MIFFLFTLFLCIPISAEKPAQSYGLQDLVDRAVESNMEVAAARWKVAASAANLRKATSARFLPRLRLDIESGLVPEAKGDIFNPPSDTSGVRPLGPFGRTELEFIQPIYPISRGRQIKSAAENGVGVEEADLREAQNQAEFEVKKLYHGVLLAQDLLELVQRLQEELEEQRGEIEESAALPMSNLYKFELALIELGKQEREATSQLDLAQRALAWQAGLNETESLQLRARWLAPVQTRAIHLDSLLTRALSQRPDWRKLQAGIAAKKALHIASKEAYKPQVFIGGGVRFAIAPGRTDQRNPFVKDEFNLFSGAAFIGVRQSLEFHLLAADVAKAEAEYRQLSSMKEHARRAAQLDVQRAHAQYRRAESDLQAARQSRSLARQWLKEAKDEYEFDPDQLKELISAFESWALIEQQYFQSIYDFNISVATLEMACGGLQLSSEDPSSLRDD